MKDLQKDLNESIPTNDDFTPVEVDNWEEEQKKYAIVPLPKDRYMFRIDSYELKKSKNHDTMANLTLSVINDSVPENNGRKVFHTVMLTGKGFGMAMDFASDLGKAFQGKTQIVAINESGQAYSPWIDTWIGTTFTSMVIIPQEVDENKKPVFDEAGKPVMSNFNRLFYNNKEKVQLIG